MLLKEFFGSPINTETKDRRERPDGIENTDDLFWFIVDHDQLHKDYFLPIAKKIKQTHNESRFDKEKILRDFMPMVEKGCKEYYTKNHLIGRLGKLFPRALREELCNRLFDHYYEDILKDQYNLGI